MRPQTTIEFLYFEGCPNTPILLQRLCEASSGKHIEEVDLMQLEIGDPRLGWGAPTILVHGSDLFGMKPAKDGQVSCRIWSDGLPSVKAIKVALRKMKL